MASLVVCVLAVATVASPAQANDSGTVSSISIKDSFSELTLSFDKPITQEDATEVRAQMRGQAAVEAYANVYCWSGGGFIDSNGSFSYQYACNSPRTIAWAFVLSATNQATVVGLVNEMGLRYWCNSALLGQNSPHSEPAGYLFHGTMIPVAADCLINFQDYFTWRHNIGSGGTAVLAQAGSLYLVN
jgi:hypothetical protein